jgi:DNA-binding NtrC family response regulator
MPGADGMEVLRSSMRINPNIAVVIITAYGTLDTALEAMNEGAYDYIVKPFVMQQLLLVVRNAFKMNMLMEENEKLSEQLKETHKKFEAFRIAGVQNSVIIDEPEEVNEIISDENDGNRESIEKYNSLVNELKIK